MYKDSWIFNLVYRNSGHSDVRCTHIFGPRLHHCYCCCCCCACARLSMTPSRCYASSLRMCNTVFLSSGLRQIPPCPGDRPTAVSFNYGTCRQPLADLQIVMHTTNNFVSAKISWGPGNRKRRSTCCDIAYTSLSAYKEQSQ